MITFSNVSFLPDDVRDCKMMAHCLFHEVIWYMMNFYLFWVCYIRSRLADFFTNCQPEARSISGCLKESYADCLLAYSGLIGKSNIEKDHLT